MHAHAHVPARAEDLAAHAFECSCAKIWRARSRPADLASDLQHHYACAREASLTHLWRRPCGGGRAAGIHQ
eukprot:5499349-Pleurochrysis_carterae.AAC.2